MKKTFLYLFVSNLIITSSLSLVSCVWNPNSLSNMQKIMHITSLNTNLLENHNVNIYGKLEQETIEDFIQNVNINFEGSFLEYFTLESFTASLRVSLAASQLLGEISTRVPNLSWVNNQINWQSSRWSINQFAHFSVTQSLAMNASGWLSTDDEFSISVTFLNEDKTGWTGFADEENPVYARINVNQRISVNEEGYLIIDESNPSAIWIDENMDENNISASEPVEQPANKQTENRGVIYQGFVNSSSLIYLRNIFNPDISSIVVLWSMTPSIIDMVNNFR